MTKSLGKDPQTKTKKQPPKRNQPKKNKRPQKKKNDHTSVVARGTPSGKKKS